MSDRKKHRTVNEFLRYLKGEDSDRERHSFERDLESDPFLKEAMEGLERISPEEAEKDLLILSSRLKKRETRRRRITWYSMAAAIASVLVIGTIFLKIHDFNPADNNKKQYLEEVQPGEVPATEKQQPALKDSTAEPEMAKAPMEKAPEETPRREKADEAAAPVEEAPSKELHFEMAPEEAVPSKAVSPVSQEMNARGAREKGVAPPAEIRATEQEPEPIVVHEAEPAAKSKGPVRARSTEKEVTEGELTEKELTGKVISAEDRSPVPGASLSMEGEDIVSITDQEGRFSIPVTHDTQLMVTASYAGMQPEELKVPPGDEVTFVLMPEAVVVGEKSAAAKKESARSGALSKVEMEPRPPEPSGGYISFYKYVEDNCRFPQGDPSLDEALVILKFKITAAGKIKNIVPVKSPGESYTKEAVRLLKEGPPWIPAFDHTGTIDKELTLRIILKK